jgi:hypothetical protein
MNFNDLVFVSAQPDIPYFHWQVKIYIHNFIEKGINPNQIHIIFSIVDGEKPTLQSLELKTYGVNVHHYVDEREQKHYIPSIKPFLIYKWLEENPQYGKSFFLHDADIVFRELPDFNQLMGNDMNYLSDTIGYIGYNYLMDCCQRYESRHSNSEKGQLIQEMVNVVGVDIECIKRNQDNSGGGQYIIKNTDAEIWKKIYSDCTPLYDQMVSYHERFPINPGQIQFWTAEMWSVLWNLWHFGKETEVTDKLSFSWGTSTLEVYETKNILHMAGVTEDLNHILFCKSDYIGIDPIELLKNDETIFDYIIESSATNKYVEIMKSMIKNESNDYLL